MGHDVAVTVDALAPAVTDPHTPPQILRRVSLTGPTLCAQPRTAGNRQGEGRQGQGLTGKELVARPRVELGTQ